LVIPVIRVYVKTAISLPDETFEEATRRSRELGISRSEFLPAPPGDTLTNSHQTR